MNDYIENPDLYDNKGILKNVDEELRNKIINGRINALLKQIKKQKGELKKNYKIVGGNKKAMKIEIVEQAFMNILNELKKKEVYMIETDVDYFMNIDISDAINFKEKNPNICVESINDDYEAIIKISNNKRKINVLDLERIANVIRVITYEIENSKINIL